MREIDTGAQEAFIKEVNEDLKNESMKKMWDKYGLYIIILVVAALTAAVSFEAIKAWYTKKLQTWSDSYAYALSLQNQGKYDESIDTFDYIAGKDYGIFSDLAKMQKANILLEQKKNDEAFKLMNEIIEDKSFNPQLRDTTILKLASYKLDNAPAEEIEELIGGHCGRRRQQLAADGKRNAGAGLSPRRQNRRGEGNLQPSSGRRQNARSDESADQRHYIRIAAITILSEVKPMRLNKKSAVAAMCLALAGCGMFGKEKLQIDGERIPVLSEREVIAADYTAGDIQIVLPKPAVNAAWPQSAATLRTTWGT